jgi:hypothetical protein
LNKKASVVEKFALLANLKCRSRLFYPTGWREATEGLSPDRAAKALMAAGYLIPDGNQPQRKVSLPDNTRARTYCVKGSILDD